MRALQFNETKITTKNALYREKFVTEGNHGSNDDKKHLLGIFADS